MRNLRTDRRMQRPLTMTTQPGFRFGKRVQSKIPDHKFALAMSFGQINCLCHHPAIDAVERAARPHIDNGRLRSVLRLGLEIEFLNDIFDSSCRRERYQYGKAQYLIEPFAIPFPVVPGDEQNNTEKQA